MSAEEFAKRLCEDLHIDVKSIPYDENYVEALIKYGDEVLFKGKMPKKK